MEDPNDASNLDPHSFFIALNVSSSDQGGSVTLDRILGRRSVGSSKTKYRHGDERLKEFFLVGSGRMKSIGDEYRRVQDAFEIRFVDGSQQ